MRPNCSGVTVCSVMRPLWTSAIWVGPLMLISSRPQAGLVLPVDDEGVAGVEQEHGLGDERDAVGGVDAHDLGAGAGGVGERAEQIEGGADAEGAANGHDGLHRRVQRGRVEVGEAMGAERGGGGVGGEIDGDAEGLEDVGRAAGGGDGAVAVLGDHDLGAGGGGDEGGGGGDVEGAGGVSAGAAGVGQAAALRVVQGQGRGGGAHGVDEAGELCGGFAAGGEGAEQGGDLDVGGVAGEDQLAAGSGLRRG